MYDIHLFQISTGSSVNKAEVKCIRLLKTNICLCIHILELQLRLKSRENSFNNEYNVNCVVIIISAEISAT